MAESVSLAFLPGYECGRQKALGQMRFWGNHADIHQASILEHFLVFCITYSTVSML